METEFEATFPNVDKKEIRSKLKSLGASLKREEFLMKRVTFNLPSNERGKWIRVRDESGKITVSLKAIIGEGIESQKEIYLEVNNFDSAVKLLEEIGCIRKAYQENKRELWDLEGVEIAIDEWPFLEPFIEVEGPNEESVKSASEKLGFDYSKAIFSSTAEQYTAKYGVSEDQVVNHTPRIAFGDENPFFEKE